MSAPKLTAPNGITPRWIPAAGLFLCTAAALATTTAFLPHQSLWTDEATQLSGLTLDPVAVVRWLTGQSRHDFGVSDDRMPPLSYWLGWVWAQVFGLTEPSLRWFGAACVAAATAVVYLTAQRAWGTASAVVAGLLVALSPNVVVQAVEIRAYPLLILTSAGVYYCLVRLLESESNRGKWIAALAACGIAASYTHFFGLVLTGGAFLALLVVFRACGDRVRPVLTAIAVVGILSLGLAPFVLASVGLSHSAAPGNGAGKLVGLARLAYRLFAHPATAVSSVAVAAALVGGTLAIAAAGAAGFVERARVVTGLMIALASGFFVVILAHFAQSNFNAAAPSYNSWALPGVALVAAAGLRAPTRWHRRVARSGCFLLLAANAYGTVQLAVHGTSFAHTPYRAVAEIVRRYEPDAVVAYDEPLAPSQVWSIYSPLRYEFGPTMRQYEWVAGSDARLVAYPNKETETDLVRVAAKHLVVVRPKQADAVQVADQVRNGVRPVEPGPLVERLSASPDWERVEAATFGSFVTTGVVVFRRRVFAP